MRAIEKDIEDNDGLRPFNKGRVTQSDACGRAGVSLVMHQGASHKETTKKMVGE